jgi:arylsulfatase A-like enzyme
MGAVSRATTTALAAVLAVAGCRNADRSAPPPPAKRPHVVILSLDTTRADRLGCYGYARPTSPHLDRLAAESVLYTRAIATSSWTLPSHASLFTGKLTTSHGAHYDPEGPLNLAGVIDGPREWREYRARPLPESERTLAEVLRDAGYATGAVVGGPWLKRPFGLAQGFDYYDDDHITTSDGRRADSVTDAALRWMERAAGRELFLFLNYYDPHGPYSPPEPFLSRFLAPGTRPSEGIPQGEELGARYDGEVFYMDHHVGRLLDGLRKAGVYEHALIVVTADHGELLGEQGRLGHGQHLTQPEIHIPFFVRYPHGQEAPRRVESPVQLTDVLPMVTRALGLPAPPGIQGGLPPSIGHPVVAEVYPLAFDSLDGDWRALFDGSWKLLWNSKGRHGLFDLAHDPGERANLAARHPERVARMASLLGKYLASLPRPGAAGRPRELDAATREALRALGYVR